MNQARWRKYSEWPLLTAALVFLVAYWIEVIENLPDDRSALFDWIIWSTWALFIVDFIANLVLAQRRGRWLVRNLHEIVTLALPMLRPLRLLRLGWRGLRGVNLARGRLFRPTVTSIRQSMRCVVIRAVAAAIARITTRGIDRRATRNSHSQQGSLCGDEAQHGSLCR
jgi:hypothetical protein